MRPASRSSARQPTFLTHVPSRVNSCTTEEYWSATQTKAPPGEEATACGKRSTPWPIAGLAPKGLGCSSARAGAAGTSASARAAARMDRGTPSRLGSARLDEQRLDGAADAPGLVEEHRLGDAGAVAVQACLGVEGDPLAVRLALEVDGEIGINEGPAVPVEDGAEAVAEVGRREGALHAARLLAGQNRDGQAHPGGGRSGPLVAAAGEADVVRGVREAE